MMARFQKQNNNEVLAIPNSWIAKMLAVAVLALLLVFGVSSIIDRAQAYTVENTNVALADDFVLEPAKTEITIEPGETVMRSFSVINRMPRRMDFELQIEDFTGSRDPQMTVNLLGDQIGPYSLKDFIRPEIMAFSLEPRQRITIEVAITVPEDAEPGGRYGSILVTTRHVAQNLQANPGQAAGGAVTISRLGGLYFVRIAGEAVEEASFEGFRVAGPHQSVYTRSPEAFELLFANNGNVHLTPSGKIEIKNIFGSVVDELDILPFFALPDSLRSINVMWPERFLIGRYSATAIINPGFESDPNHLVARTITFWVLPWKHMAVAFAGLIILVLLLKFILSKFEIRRK